MNKPVYIHVALYTCKLNYMDNFLHVPVASSI
jgi:hypothetical protein